MLTINDLHGYQKYAIATAIKKQHCCLFLGTGLGKTIIALTIVDQLLKRKWIQSALVICTKKAMYNTWRQEARDWKHTRYLTFSVMHGDLHSGPSSYVRRSQLYKKSHIYLVNYEGLNHWLADELARKYSNRPLPFQMVVYDESTKIKHSTSQRFRKFKKQMGRFTYRYPMTGTPAPNGPIDLFGQMYVCDLGTSLGENITSYRTRFFVLSHDGHSYKPIKGTKKAVSRRIKDRVINMPKEDYIKLPSITYNKIMLDLPDKIRDQYDELESKFFVDLGQAKVEAFSALALSAKLRQFIQGKVYHGIGKDRVTIPVHTEKLDMISEVMEGIGNCIVAYNFQYERNDLQSVFKGAPAIDGRTSDRDASEYIQQWDRGELPVLLCNPASNLHGLNLQKGGHNVLWYGLTWNLEHYIQLIDRLWRQGQKNKVFVHHIMFRNTVDEVLYQTLTAKSVDQASLINNLRTYQKGRTR